MSQSLVAKVVVAMAVVVLMVGWGLCWTARAEGHTTQVKLTFYGYPDNDPPGRAIHYPGPAPRHGQAGGVGTYDNPTTVAGGRWAPGTRLYLPYLNKYLIVEDSCAGCSWNHIDVWVGGSSRNDSAVIACEHRLTPAGTVPVEVDPPDGYAVSSGTLC